MLLLFLTLPDSGVCPTAIKSLSLSGWSLSRCHDVKTFTISVYFSPGDKPVIVASLQLASPPPCVWCVQPIRSDATGLSYSWVRGARWGLLVEQDVYFIVGATYPELRTDESISHRVLAICERGTSNLHQQLSEAAAPRLCGADNPPISSY